jgi:hypothetical protein
MDEKYDNDPLDIPVQEQPRISRHADAPVQHSKPIDRKVSVIAIVLSIVLTIALLLTHYFLVRNVKHVVDVTIHHDDSTSDSRSSVAITRTVPVRNTSFVG